ncbi:hypothetical protein SDC9_121514 [bioreactor metagenome]|uniref:Uncharacterized protein n=1 Tax=bioreactor metagenome TaxID=1076179 RepID=A0A645CC46_9ZZZZ
MQYVGHRVEGLGQRSDLILRFHRQFMRKFARCDQQGSLGDVFNGIGNRLGQKKAHADRDDKAEQQRLNDDREDDPGHFLQFLLRVFDINDIKNLAVLQGKGVIEIGRKAFHLISDLSSHGMDQIRSPVEKRIAARRTCDKRNVAARQNIKVPVGIDPQSPRIGA